MTMDEKTTVRPAAMWLKRGTRQDCRLVCAFYSSGTVSHMLPLTFGQPKISLISRETVEQETYINCVCSCAWNSLLKSVKRGARSKLIMILYLHPYSFSCCL